MGFKVSKWSPRLKVPFWCVLVPSVFDWSILNFWKREQSWSVYGERAFFILCTFPKWEIFTIVDFPSHVNKEPIHPFMISMGLSSYYIFHRWEFFQWRIGCIQLRSSFSREDFVQNRTSKLVSTNLLTQAPFFFWRSSDDRPPHEMSLLIGIFPKS